MECGVSDPIIRYLVVLSSGGSTAGRADSDRNGRRSRKRSGCAANDADSQLQPANRELDHPSPIGSLSHGALHVLFPLHLSVPLRSVSSPLFHRFSLHSSLLHPRHPLPSPRRQPIRRQAVGNGSRCSSAHRSRRCDPHRPHHRHMGLGHLRETMLHTVYGHRNRLSRNQIHLLSGQRFHWMGVSTHGGEMACERGDDIRSATSVIQ